MFCVHGVYALNENCAFPSKNVSIQIGVRELYIWRYTHICTYITTDTLVHVSPLAYLYIYIYISLPAHLYIYRHTHICTYIAIRIRCIFVYINMFCRAHICTQIAFAHILQRAHLYIQRYPHICIYIHIHWMRIIWFRYHDTLINRC